MAKKSIPKKAAIAIEATETAVTKLSLTQSEGQDFYDIEWSETSFPGPIAHSLARINKIGVACDVISELLAIDHEHREDAIGAPKEVQYDPLSHRQHEGLRLAQELLLMDMQERMEEIREATKTGELT